MGIKLGDNINVTAGLPNDCRYQNAATGPYTSITEANSIIGSDIRYIGLTININNNEYWYKDGIEDSDLVEKTTGGGGLLNWTGNTVNAVGTYMSISGICAQPNMIFDGNTLSVVGIISASTCFVGSDINLSGVITANGGNSTQWNSGYTHSQLQTGNPHSIAFIDLTDVQSPYVANKFLKVNSTNNGIIYVDEPQSMIYPSAGIAVSTGTAWASSISGTSSQFVKGDGSLDSQTYLTSYTETDPTVGSHIKSITTGDIDKWVVGYNHSNIITGNPHNIAFSDLDGNPSDVITAGTNLTWDGSTLNATGGTTYWTQSGNDIYYNDGNVGIGTTNPTLGKIHIENNDLTTLALRNTTGTNNSKTGEIFFITDASTRGGKIYGYRGAHSAQHSIGFETMNSDTEKYTPLWLNYNGNVGIGTTNPVKKLDISGDAILNNNGLFLRTNTQELNGAPKYGIGLSNIVSSTNYYTQISDYYGLTFATEDNQRLTITRGGNVLIGTTTDSGYKLDINGTLRIKNNGNTALRIAGQNDTTTIYRIDAGNGITDDSNYGFSLKYMGTRAGVNNSLSLFVDNIQATQTEAITILNDGKIGINNITPSYKLDINGTERVTGNLTVGGNITATGDVTAYYTSDKRLKTNINQFKATELIEKMNPVIFNWNDKAKELNENKDDRNNFGLIAQDLEKTIPELIHPIYKDYKAIDYVQIISILIQSNKEQQTEINELKTEMNKLNK